MPKEMERSLGRKASSMGLKKGSERWRAYVFGTMRQMGWKPRRER